MTISRRSGGKTANAPAPISVGTQYTFKESETKPMDGVVEESPATTVV